ncbi:MAG TPA: TniQ family protein [Pyrinomonadaceae bacterium]|jgi:AraC-like DNA-binding protein
MLTHGLTISEAPADFPPSLPPRSRLFHLEPVGVGTPYVESLSGYVSRLAEKHSTTLYYLFSIEVAPLINKPGTISRRVSFASFAKAVNGLGAIAADLVDVFEKLTLRNDLTYTTMLPWAKATSSKSLTRETRAWCPVCYEECVASRSKVYDQLLWTIQSVTACAKHEQLLEHRCPHCGKRQHILSHRSRPEFCSRCRGWLGSKPSHSTQVGKLKFSEPTEEEIRIAEEVGKLLAAAPNYASSAVTLNFTENLWAYVETMFMGRGRPSQMELPAGRHAIRCWVRGSQTPSLPLLLKTCLALEISPVDLLRKSSDDKSKYPIDVPTPEERVTICRAATGDDGADSSRINWKDPESLARIEGRLRDALSEKPPSSLTRIAKELKCTRGTLRKKFPELAAQVAERADVYYRPSISIERVSELLRAALNENPPPSLQEVSRRLGKGGSTVTLHKKFPEESRVIIERYCAHHKRRLDDESIEKKLRAALEIVPPPSMPEVSRDMGVSRPTLLSKFPELYKAVSNRFAVYRREEDARKRENARSEIKTICEQALREGVYPSDALVRSQLSIPCQSEALSKIRREVLAKSGVIEHF